MKQTKFLISLAFMSIIFLVMVTSCSGGNNTDSQRHVSAVDDCSAAVESTDLSQIGNDVAGDSSRANEAGRGVPTVIDFYATWCGPCKNIAPLFDMLKGEYSSKINFVSVDVDQDVALAEKYGIAAMPTFVFLDAEGNEIDRIVGADSEKLAETVDRLANQ